MSKSGKLLVISGPSGTGKGTVIKKLFEKRNDVCMSISATTRQPRPGEKDGENYFFMTKEKFEKMIEDNLLLEHAQFCGNYYGTPKPFVEKMLSEGKNVILEIEVNGAMQIRQKCCDAVLIFIMPPSMEELRIRLTGRKTEDSEVIEKRLTAAQWEMTFASKYDYEVVNDEVEKAADRLSNIIDELVK